MKTLKFNSDLVSRVLSGEKTETWRLFDDKELSEGDELSLVNRDSGEEFARAAVTNVTETTLGDIDYAAGGGHEAYASREEMYETFRGYYGDAVGPDTAVKIVSFTLFDASGS